MPFAHRPAFLTSAFAALAYGLPKRSAARLPLRWDGIRFARGRRTVTSWFRAAGITDEFRPAYPTIGAVGRRATSMAMGTRHALQPLRGNRRLRGAIDDTPTARYGPGVEGAGIHHHPRPGPAGEKYV